MSDSNNSNAAQHPNANGGSPKLGALGKLLGKETPSGGQMTNPYITAQNEWDERFAFHAGQARRWFYVSMGTLGFAAVALGFGIWAAVKTEYVPYIVAVDKLGQAAVAASPQFISDWPTSVVKREVADFVSNWRSVPSDVVVLNNNLRRMFYFLQSGDPANTKIKERNANPETAHHRMRETKTVEVDVVSVNFVGGNSWLVEWRETTRQRSTGSILQIAIYKGTFVLKPALDISPEILTKNPLAMIVEDFDVQQQGNL